MKRIDAWALALLVVRVLLLIPAVHQGLGISEALFNAWGIFDFGTSVHVIAVSLLHSATQIAVAVILFLWARRVGQPAYLWALLGVVWGLVVLPLFLILRVDELREKHTQFSLRLPDSLAVLVVVGLLGAALVYNEFVLRDLLLGHEWGDAAGAFGVHQMLQSRVTYAYTIATSIGIAVWLWRRAERYRSTPVLPFLVGIVLGPIGAVLLELWHLWCAMGGSIAGETSAVAEDT